MSSATTRKTMYNEKEDMLAVLIGGANIIFSIISHWFKSSTLKYINTLDRANMSLLFGLAVGAAFLFVGTQMRGKERAQPLLVASLVMVVFFFGRFWASPAKEIFPSGILAALRYRTSNSLLIEVVSVSTSMAPLCLDKPTWGSDEIYKVRVVLGVGNILIDT
jgi:hypothetical protein